MHNQDVHKQIATLLITHFKYQGQQFDRLEKNVKNSKLTES